MTQVKNKVALVTGASSGIGEATAIALARNGAKVSLMARREDRLISLCDKIAAEGLEKPIYFCSDVQKSGDIEKSVNGTVEKFGRVDILINNAGVMYLGPIEGANIDDWKRMFDINVLGLMHCTHAVLPLMIKNGYGHIVNISSVSGKVVSARSAAYSATKFAVGAFSEGLRQEVAKQGLRVTVIQPGAVATELTDHISDSATKKSVKDWVAGMQALTSEDIANAIVYAVSQPPSVNVNEITIRPTDQTF
ncbi:MAG: SDR family NAD(P)-dependent oxidoreductase [Candidatus Melainabacteria bacterium]|jgi:NADP-dependent 3-hydroxy acid dehydrogenase YdfG|nr:SDR family NAD(P)-dependent oxidoreductase [Candidatus Melainabacteria bacterium]